jgi:hypothetical protein
MASPYSLSHLSDQTLLSNLAALEAQDCTTAAALLAHLAEVDARKLYLPAGYPSMYLYCVHERRLSEDAAYKRIQAARTALRFPAIFEAVAAGDLHLSAVCLVAPYLTLENADGLLKATGGKTKSEIESLLAERFPRPELLALAETLPASPSLPDEQPAPGQVETCSPRPVRPSIQLAPGQVAVVPTRSKMAPVAHQRVAMQLVMSQSTHDKLRYAQELLSHRVHSGDVGQVLDRALDLLIRQLEKTKFAATDKPRLNQRRPAAGSRHIPAHIKRAVWQRDGGRCTFVSQAGHRCPARTLLEFDHLDPVARGGQATVSRIRLRCRAHNQYAAECTFGTEFMKNKRQEAASAREAKAGEKAAAMQARERDVISGLRGLGFRADEARSAAALCQAIPDAPLEQRMRVALTYFAPRRPIHFHAGSL